MTDTANDLLRLVRAPENPCFVCAPHNPTGLRAGFRVEGEVIRSRWTPNEHHQGWQGVVHGGVLASLLDEAMAYTLFARGVMGMTARMEIRYRSPARAGDPLEIEARCVRRTRALAEIDAHISLHGERVAEARGRFIVVGTIDAETLFRKQQ